MAHVPEENNEIDILKILNDLWKAKIFIIFLVLISVVFSSFYLRLTEYKYTVSILLKPVQEEINNSQLSRFGQLATIAGSAGLLSKSSTTFDEFQIKLYSKSTAEKKKKKTELIRELYIGEWNHSKQTYEQPPIGSLEKFKNLIKLMLTGRNPRPYISPTPKRLSKLIENTLQSEVTESGFLLIQTETSNPKLYLKLISELVEMTDKLFKINYIRNGESAVMFYQTKISKARSQEHRIVLAKLIASEEQKLMLASRDSRFVAENLLKPSITLSPTSPRAVFVLLINALISLFIGFTTTMIRSLVRAN